MSDAGDEVERGLIQRITSRAPGWIEVSGSACIQPL
jgi:hypothetical protein